MAGMVAAGCLLGALPLLIALLLAGAALERLTGHSERLVVDGLNVARLGGELRDRVVALERSARQYVALGDPALLDLFYSRLLEAEATLRDIERGAPGPPVATHVQRTRAGLAAAAEAWTEGLHDAESLAGAVEQVHALNAEAEAVIASGRTAVEAQVAELRSASAQARTVMLVSSLALIPLTALLAFGISVAVTRPLRRLRGSVVALGHAQYDEPIKIQYPTEMRHLGERLDWLRRRLSRLEADKERFLRHVSHELKTPLASLHAGTELLRDGALGPLTRQQAEVTQILQDAAGELRGLIANLLAYSEWRDDRRQPDLEWFEAQPLLEEVVGAHRQSMQRRNVSAELDLRCARLFGQRSRLRVALDNLVTNAIKHAPEATSIELRAAAVDGHCELSVRDQGRGVPDHDKGRVFEPFVRGAEAEETGARGTGIGLSIVRDAVVAHGGTVEVEDAHPGARFTLVWPAPRPGTAAVAAGRHAHA